MLLNVLKENAFCVVSYTHILLISSFQCSVDVILPLMSEITDIVSQPGGISDKIVLKVLYALCLWVDVCHSILKLPIYVISASFLNFRQQALMSSCELNLLT